MDTAPTYQSRGLSLILEHCARVGERRPPIASRLEKHLGRELSRRLLSALAGDHRARARLV